MKPVRSYINQYIGINAHLHSYLQGKGIWSDFHLPQTVHLANTLKPHLLPIGYTTELERSIQTERVDELDVLDSEMIEPLAVTSAQVSTSSGSELVLPILGTILINQVVEKGYTAIAIYKITSHRADRGKPVAWIELLIPSNKPGGRDSDRYLARRLKIIENNIVYIEIDYLHESPATLRGFPSYRPRSNQPHEKNAHSYRILVIDPRPDLIKGTLHLCEFDVDEPIPTLTIPLNGGDKISFDFGVAYRKTFEESYFGLELVDYRQLPLNFDRYSPNHQTRIANRMLSVLQAAMDGIDLEMGPFECEDNELEMALKKIERVGSLV